MTKKMSYVKKWIPELMESSMNISIGVGNFLIVEKMHCLFNIAYLNHAQLIKSCINALRQLHINRFTRITEGFKICANFLIRFSLTMRHV